MHGGRYRPMYCPQARSGARRRRQAGRLAARIVGQSIMAGTPFEAVMVKNGIDPHLGRGRGESALCDPQHRGRTDDHRRPACRSCGGASSAVRTPPIAVEAFIDEVAHAAGQGSVRVPARAARASPRHEGGARARGREGRLGQRRCPRARAAASPSPRPSGTYVAQVAEVTVGAERQRSRSTASSARSIAARRSIPTSSRRRWKAASASASAPRSTARSR